MKPSVEGLEVAKSSKKVSEGLNPSATVNFEERRASIAKLYVEDASTEEQKKSIIGQLIYWASVYDERNT